MIFSAFLLHLFIVFKSKYQEKEHRSEGATHIVA